MTIGNWIGPQILQQIIGARGRKFDGRKFGWLGVPATDDNVCALTKASGISNMKDWINAKKPVKIGATGPGSSTDDGPKILAAATGLPIKIVEGYAGTATVRVAAERGEVDGGCFAWQSIKVTWRQGVESGNVKPIIQFGAQPHNDLKNVPLASQFAKSKEGKKLLRVSGDVYGAISRPYSLPPGVPAERLKILQKAFMATLNDPQLIAEAKKSKLELNPHDGNWVTKKVADTYNLNPEMLSQLKKILLPKH